MGDTTPRICVVCESQIDQNAHGAVKVCSQACSKLRARNRQKKWNEENREYVRERDQKRYIENREVYAEQSRRWYAQNRDLVAERAKQRRKDNPAVFSERRRTRYEANKERYLEQTREYYRNNRAKYREYRRDWDTRNPERAREFKRVRRAIKMSATVIAFTVDQWEQKKAYWGNRCYLNIPGICTGEAATMEHVKPLSTNSPSAHMLANLRPACQPCNSSKSNKWPYAVPAGPVSAT